MPNGDPWDGLSDPSITPIIIPYVKKNLFFQGRATPYIKDIASWERESVINFASRCKLLKIATETLHIYYSAYKRNGILWN